MQTDRWIEFDLFLFQEKPLEVKIRETMERMAPLYQDVEGDRGIILCCGFIGDLVTEWRGAADQELPFQCLSARNWLHKTYADFRDFVRMLKVEAARAGIPDFKVAVMFVGWGEFDWGPGYYYDYASAWFARHPEVYFPDHWKSPDFRKRLKKDDYPYASHPGGTVEGMSFGQLFGGQWGLVSRFLELDAIVLRDAFLGPCIYEITGPFGSKGTKEPALAEEWSRELIAFYREVKQANPECLVMGYSSARSAVAEYRVGCFDLRALVAADALDVWIDQTWAGAWQDWWEDSLRGWTFQLANVLVHQAMIAAGNASRKKPCRHYHLIETFCGYEPWDTLHQVPQKLRWGIWAFTHAAIQSGGVWNRTLGSYIAFGHNSEHRLICPQAEPFLESRLLSEEDVDFLRTHLNAAVRSAEQIEEVYGPAMAVNLEQMAAVQQSCPADNTGDLVDDNAALLMKWGFPCLSGVLASELLPRREGWLVQTPARLSDKQWELLRQPDSAYIAAGRGDCIDERLLNDVCVKNEAVSFPWGVQRLKAPDLVPDEIPRVSVVTMAPCVRMVPAGAETVAETKQTLIAARAKDAAKFVWQPLYPYGAESSKLTQAKYGSMAPFAALARAWHEAMKKAGLSYLEPIPFQFPATFHFWRSGGRVFILVGNLETGVAGDSRSPREIRAVLRKAQLRLDPGARHTLGEQHDGTVLEPFSETAEEVVFHIPIAPLGSGVYQISKKS